MKANVKKQWVKDLRSGEFERTTGRLKRGERYCVLGVLALRYPGTDCSFFPDGEFFGDSRDSIPEGFFSSRVNDWCGLPADSHLEIALISDKDVSFSETADWIEINIPAEPD